MAIKHLLVAALSPAYVVTHHKSTVVKSNQQVVLTRRPAVLQKWQLTLSCGIASGPAALTIGTNKLILMGSRLPHLTLLKKARAMCV